MSIVLTNIGFHSLDLVLYLKYLIVKVIDRNWATRPLLCLFGQQRAVVHLRVFALLCCIHFSRSLFITHRERREYLIERTVAETTYIKECLGHQGTKHNGTADRRKCEALCSILCCGRGQDIVFLYWTFCSPQSRLPGFQRMSRLPCYGPLKL